MTASFVLSYQETEPGLGLLQASLNRPSLHTFIECEISVAQLEEWLAVVSNFVNDGRAEQCEISAGAINEYPRTSGFHCSIARENLKFLVRINARDACLKFGNIDCCLQASGYFVTELGLIDSFRFQLTQLVRNRCGNAVLEEAGSFSLSY
ncbi:hypothetical protein NX774_01070 [Massilia agilis]|uniref:Uncharacterized protein n=1 Tax=Massilia agilis TaxID=1811226 RepID=A0ABT2D5C4_9BURK|nr:hypothetical protein [Massilia agilis]MCS0806514.1 hypothetical protein [Massilia agilis]